MEVKVKIKSTIKMLCVPADNALGVAASEDDTVIRYSVTGEYTEENGRAAITYKEPEEFGFEGETTALVFDTGDKSVLTMARSGNSSAAFRFDMTERRQKCVYDTPYMSCEFTINTRKIANTVKNGNGAILVDYIIEMSGNESEHNRTLIEVHPI